MALLILSMCVCVCPLWYVSSVVFKKKKKKYKYYKTNIKTTHFYSV